jgi:hypothetical protein
MTKPEKEALKRVKELKAQKVEETSLTSFLINKGNTANISKTVAHEIAFKKE